MLTQPISQVRLTNVALIKYKIHNKKYEIACYKNKAINWRNGIEKDLDEVLQSNKIFTNASQGLLASKEELKIYFPGLETKEILKTILDNGELQISDKERDSNLNNIFNDISNIITEKCVHSISKRPISIDSVRQGIKDIHFPIKLDQPPKKQALLCLKQLMRKFLIARAEMKIDISCKETNKEKLFLELEKIGVNIPLKKEAFLKKDEENFSFSLLIEPAKYREIDNILKSVLKDGMVQVLIPYVANKEVTDIETAGTVNLEIRPDYKEGDELKDSEDEPLSNEQDSQKKKNKKKKKENKSKNKEDVSEEKSDEEESLSKKQKNKKGSKNKEIKGNAKNNQEKTELEEKKIEEKEVEKKESGKPGLKCLSCKEAHFQNNAEFRNHFKSEWHNLNLKRKIEKLPALTEKEFEVLQLDKEFLKEKN